MQPLIGSGELILAAWQNFRKNARFYADFSVCFAFLGVVQWAILIGTRTLVPDKVIRLVVLALFMLPVVVAIMFLSAALIAAVNRHLDKKTLTTGDAFHAAAHALVPLIWVSVLTTLAVFGGLLLFVIPAIIFFIRYKFATNAVVIDDIRGGTALSASARLVSGRWWATALRVAIPAIFFSMAVRFVISLAYLLVGAGFGDPGMFFGRVAEIDLLSNTQTLITSVIPQAIQGLSLPLFLGADLLLWRDLKKKTDVGRS